MKLIKKLIINISSIAGLIFPRLFFIKKAENQALLSTIFIALQKYHNTYRKIRKINKKEKFIDPKNLNEFFNHNLGEESFSLLTLDDGFDNNFEFANTIRSNQHKGYIFYNSRFY